MMKLRPLIASAAILGGLGASLLGAGVASADPWGPHPHPGPVGWGGPPPPPPYWAPPPPPYWGPPPPPPLACVVGVCLP
ncbi:hypothetical protein [Mycolicibacterium sphagni]|nr:hypothetical protein [Mycolicibacterium sphagni]